MLRFRNILNFPSFFRKRQNSVLTLGTMIKKVYRDDNDQLIIVGGVNKYSPTIQFGESDVDMNNTVKISCDCQSFNFEFARTLFDNNSLFQPENFQKAIRSVPKKKNAFMVESGCKHVIALARFINKNQFRLGI